MMMVWYVKVPVQQTLCTPAASTLKHSCKDMLIWELSLCCQWQSRFSRSLKDEDVLKWFSNKTASPFSIICTYLPFQWYVICSGFNVLLKDSLAEKLFTVTGIYTLAFKLRLTALLTFSMPSLFYSFITPVPTDKAVISTPDKAASLCIWAGAEGGNFLKNGMTSLVGHFAVTAKCGCPIKSW